jgi:IQ domain-containing protein H
MLAIKAGSPLKNTE